MLSPTEKYELWAKSEARYPVGSPEHSLSKWLKELALKEKYEFWAKSEARYPVGSPEHSLSKWLKELAFDKEAIARREV